MEDFTDTTVAPVFIGAAVSCVLYGITCSQTIWYYRSYPQDRKLFKALVGFVWLMETMQEFLASHMLWHYLVRRGWGESFRFFLCANWSLTAQIVPTEICCMLVEGFFIMRMWMLSQRKKLTFIVFIPMFVSWGSIIGYVVKIFQRPCVGEPAKEEDILTVAATTRTLTDALIAGTMCYMLYKRRSGVLPRGDSLLKTLLIWTLTTGLLTCIATVAFLILFVTMPFNLIYMGVYLSHGRVYVNALLATLNSRITLRSLADQTIQLDHISMDSVSTV